jgi:hypothetical protein
MRQNLLSLAFLLAACDPTASPDAMGSTAQTQQPPSDHPGVQLIDEYVRRDAQGERLGNAGWFLNNSVWEDEPAYDRYAVVSRSEIEPLSGDSSTARVRVIQDVVGFVTGDGDRKALFTEERGVETTVFTAVLMDNGWRIAAPQRPQHVLVDSVLRKAPFDSSTRARLQLLLRTP